MTKATKESVNYSLGMVHSHCGKVFPNDHGYCLHFKGAGSVMAKGLCTEVEGEISPIYWCQRFERAKK